MLNTICCIAAAGNANPFSNEKNLIELTMRFFLQEVVTFLQLLVKILIFLRGSRLTKIMYYRNRTFCIRHGRSMMAGITGNHH
jgi:hypothetical protein